MKLLKSLSVFQGVYIILTTLWPLLDIHSFMAVTGEKTDVWLVLTVALLLLPVGLLLLLKALVHHGEWDSSLLLGLLTAAGLCYIDLRYCCNGTLSLVYLADGVLQGLLAIFWIFAILRSHRRFIL